MRRLITTAVAALAFMAGAVLPADAAPDRPTHTSTEVRNVCRLLELYIGGAEPNYVGLAKYRALHLNFGGPTLHLAQCCFYDIRNGSPFVGQYSWGFDDVDWFSDPWCG